MFSVVVEKCTLEKDKLLFSIDFDDKNEAQAYADKLSLDYEKENPSRFDDCGLFFENPYSVWVVEK